MFVLLDCRHEAQAIDLEFMEWLGENEVPFAIVFTKIDKLGKGRLQENINAYKQKLLETWEELPPIFLTSAETGKGRDELTQYIEDIPQNHQSVTEYWNGIFLLDISEEEAAENHPEFKDQRQDCADHRDKVRAGVISRSLWRGSL